MQALAPPSVAFTTGWAPNVLTVLSLTDESLVITIYENRLILSSSSGESALSTSATTPESLGGKLRPLLSLFADLSERSRAASDRISVTKRIFFDGVVHGLRGEVLDREGTFLAAGDMHMVGAFVEGESMGLALSDRLLPWRAENWHQFAEMHMVRHPYELYTGLGMGLGYLNARDLSLTSLLRNATLYEWFALDGYAFQQALQNPARFVQLHRRLNFPTLPPHATHVMDQGIGRALWFIFSGNTARIADAISAFPAARRADLWLGLGVAAGHTASAATDDLRRLVSLCGDFVSHFRTGALVSAHVRSLSGTRSLVTDTACLTLTGLTAVTAADIVSSAHRSVATTGAAGHAEWQKLILSSLPER